MVESLKLGISVHFPLSTASLCVSEPHIPVPALTPCLSVCLSSCPPPTLLSPPPQPSSCFLHPHHPPLDCQRILRGKTPTVSPLSSRRGVVFFSFHLQLWKIWVLSKMKSPLFDPSSPFVYCVICIISPLLIRDKHLDINVYRWVLVVFNGVRQSWFRFQSVLEVSYFQTEMEPRTLLCGIFC